MQPHMQTVKRCQAPAKPRGGDIMSQHQDMLANRRTEKKVEMSDYLKQHNNNNSSAIWHLSSLM